MAANMISKRAKDESIAKKMVSTLWKSNMGLFENIFRLAPYLSSLLGVPWWKILMMTIGSYGLGLDISGIGKKLDLSVGTGPGSVSAPDLGSLGVRIEDFFNKEISTSEAVTGTATYELSKTAINLSILKTLVKTGKIAKFISAGLIKFVTGLIALFGLASIDDLVRGVFQKDLERAPSLPENSLPLLEPKKRVNKTVNELRKKYQLGE